MAAEAPPVLRFPISEKKDEFFLLELTPYGSEPLDLKLRGSDGFAKFTAKLRDKRIREHKAANGHCTDEEWKAILVSAFVHHQPRHDIEIKAEVPPDASYVELRVSRKIDKIRQRLGAVKLTESPAENIEPFDWCVSVIATRERVEEELAAAKAKAQTLEHSVDELKNQLKGLIQAKEDDETQLLERFRDLLNEKKVKIRQQQRLLAAVDVDTTKVAAGVSGAGRKVAVASRGAKRKTKGGDNEAQSTDEDVKMEVDSIAGESGGPQLDPEENEPETTDDEGMDNAATETESDGIVSPPPASPSPPPKSKGKQTARGRTTRATASKPTPSKDSGSKTKRGAAAKAKPASPPNETSEDSDDIPPPRTLPFSRGNKAKAPPPPPQQAPDDDETESDDEL